MVEDAFDPAPALGAVGAVGHHRRVLLRDARLVVEAVGDPAAHLEWQQFAAVQAQVERMVDVIPRFAGAQPRLELVGTPWCSGCQGCIDESHSEISMPS